LALRVVSLRCNDLSAVGAQRTLKPTDDALQGGGAFGPERAEFDPLQGVHRPAELLGNHPHALMANPKLPETARMLSDAQEAARLLGRRVLVVNAGMPQRRLCVFFQDEEKFEKFRRTVSLQEHDAHVDEH
jgi:hypothetical protein